MKEKRTSSWDAQNERLKQQLFKQLKEKLNSENIPVPIPKMKVMVKIKYNAIIKAVKPNLDENFRLCFEVQNARELDAMSSSSYNGSFITLGIGVDPFALNNRHYQNIMGTSTCEKSDIKSGEEKLRDERDKHIREEKQWEMMLAPNWE